MAAFAAPDPDDRDAFNRHWQRNMSRDTVTIRTITVDGQVAGHVASFVDDGDLEVTYWIGRDFWGQGLATRALALFLDEMTERPVYARAAIDNIGCSGCWRSADSGTLPPDPVSPTRAARKLRS